MSGEPVWLRRPLVEAAHAQQIAEHGGDPALRDEGLLESTLARPLNKWAYEQSSLHELAAAYGFGLIRNHAFVDGNKRIELVAIDTFLMLNGQELTAAPADVYRITLGVADGTISEPELADWIAANSAPLA